MTSDVNTAELDAWLAEHLLGGPWANPGWYWFRGTSETDGFPDIDVPRQEPLYSGPKLNTTGDGMLMVLEAMRERGWLMLTIPGEAASWRAEAYRASDSFAGHIQHSQHPVANKSANTLPLAVAFAARAALDAPTPTTGAEQ